MLCYGCGVRYSNNGSFCRSCGRVFNESKLALRANTDESVLFRSLVPVLISGLGGMAVVAISAMAIRSFVSTILRLLSLFSLGQKDSVRSGNSPRAGLRWKERPYFG